MTKGIYSEDHLARESLQARIISEIFSKRLPGVILKGGLAMRALCDSTRLTKDIDLDSLPQFSREVAKNALRLAIRKSCSDSSLISNPVVSEPKQTETTMRWKIVGRVPGGLSSIHLTVEVSRRPSAWAEEAVETQSPKWGPLLVYSAKALAATKVNALTEPLRSAPRDLFDLHTLIETGIEPPVDLLSSLGLERLKLARQELWPKIESYSFERFQEEIRPFMPAESFDSLDEDSWNSMRLAVGEAVESWLDQSVKNAEATPSKQSPDTPSVKRPGARRTP